MTYLSRLIIDLRQREVQRDIADCHRLHDRLMRAFPAAPSPDNAREHFGVLFRIEPLGMLPLARLLVQSNRLPDWSALPPAYLGIAPDARGNPAVRSVSEEYSRITTGLQLRFRLRANPTKKISDRNPTEPAAAHGKRVELRREADQLAWLERKASAHGFQLVQVQCATETPVLDVRIGDAPKQFGRQGERRLSFGVAIFDGLLEVADRDAFQHALDHGIGSAKAFGFGLLSIGQITREIRA